MTLEEDVARRVGRFAAVAFLMLISGLSALGHIAVTVRGRAVGARVHARRF